MSGTIDLLQDRAVAFDQTLRVHARNVVEPEVEVVAVAVAQEAAFFLQPAIELRARQGLQQAHHGQRNRAVANEIHLAVEDVVGIVVETHDETGHHFHAVALDAAHAFEQAAVGVLHLLRFLQAFLGGRFDAQEDAVEAGVLHHLQQLGVVRQIHGGFGVEAERAAVPHVPFRHDRQQLLHLALVADEIVVHDENRAAPLARIELLELGHHLRGRLGARLAAIDLDDVAELAVERAAARILDGHGAVVLGIDQVEVRQRRGIRPGSSAACRGAWPRRVRDRRRVRRRFFRFAHDHWSA